MEFHQGKKHFGDSSLNASGVWTTEVTRKALPGDIVMSVRAPVGPINYVEREVCIGRGLASIRPNASIKRGFLEKFLLMNEGRINGHAGATFNSINKKEIEGILVPLPPPEEQERIVKVLDEAFAAIDKAKANIERNLTNARELFQSRLNDIFSNPSEDWEERDFGEVCEIIGGSQPPKSTFKYEPQEGYVRLVQVRDYRTEKFKTFIPKSLAKKFCDSSDIMIGRYGPPIFGIFGGLEGAYNVALMKAVPDESMVDKEYFRWFLKSRDLVRFVELTSKRAAGQDGVRKERLYAYPTPIPPMRVQRAIIEELTHLNELNIALIGAFESKLEDLEELRQSILEQAFEGKLTGPVAA